MEMGLSNTEGLVAEFIARERVPLLDELLMTALLFLDRSSMQPSRHTPTFSEVLELKFLHRALPARQRMTEIELFTGEPTV